MKAFFTVFLLLAFYSGYCQTTSTNKFVLLEYGLRYDNEFSNARWVVGDKWGITFDQAAGCFVSEKLIDSIKSVNAVSTTGINKAYGIDWKKQFDREVEIELEKQGNAKGLLRQKDFIQKKEKQLKADGNGLNFLLTPIRNSQAYSVKVYGYGEWKGKSALVIFYKATVDIEKKSVVIESDKPEPLR